jgi:hypothetical protein
LDEEDLEEKELAAAEQNEKLCAKRRRHGIAMLCLAGFFFFVTRGLVAHRVPSDEGIGAYLLTLIIVARGMYLLLTKPGVNSSAPD